MRALLRHPRHVWHVIAVFTRYWVAPRLPFRRGPRLPGPVRMRLALEELGGAWIKLGQMLAMRFDLLPAGYSDELFKLLNQVRPFPCEQVREIVRQELGGLPEAVFRTFDAESFAAASIGQVHRATLPTGELVAVKVQRPGIRESLQADIDLMYAFSRFIDWTHLFGATRSRTVIDEFARWTADELDYLVEARQAVLLYEHARGEPFERIARVYRDYSTSRVLTAELIEGIPLIDVIVASRDRNMTYLDGLKARGVDLDRVVRRLDWNMLNQVYVFGYFHADLHPANLFVLPGDGIGYVDFGIVGQLPDDVRESLTRYGWLLFRGEIEEATGELMRWLAPTPDTDVVAARRQLVRDHQAFFYDISGPAMPETGSGAAAKRERPADNPYSKLAVDIMKTTRANELTLSSSLVAYLKMLVMLGTIRHQLAVEYDLTRAARSFFSRLIRQQAIDWLDPRSAMDRLYAGSVRMRRALEFVEFIEAQQPFIVAAERSLFGFRGRLRRARRRLVSLGISALVVGAALYVVLADDRDVRNMLPSQMPYDAVHLGLLVVLIVLIVSLVAFIRGLSRED
ncbi:MAG TPA: AarF/UbiB family protein [Patescibacteria group bacterium]|nr:AarF/UbiB family protein [Patescibacteria group bacterium]